MRLIIPPGKRKFKLRKLAEPYTDKQTGVRYEFITPELNKEVCTNCHQGKIFTAYGYKDGLWDVYSFPCKCTFPASGLDYWQTDDISRYKNRPVDYQCTDADLPGYVFIHPIHAREKLRAVNLMVKYLTEKMALQDQQGEDLPF